MSWTDERIDELRRLWAEGLSASQIATQLGGVTRNAVIGKIHRMGLSGRVKTPKPRVTAPRRTAPRPAPVKSPPRVMAVGSVAVKVVEREAVEPEPLPAMVVQPSADIVPIGGGVSLMELTPTSCRWPVGDPADDDLRFCGARCGPGEVYCRAHADLAFPSRGKAKSKKANA